MWSSADTSDALASVTRINVGIPTRRSSITCALTPALARRKCAHGNSFRQRSIVVESTANAAAIPQPPQVRVDRQLDPGGGDHRHRRVAVYARVASLVGLGQRAPRRPGADAAVVPARPQRPQARDRLAQAGPPGQLRERHAEQLVHAREPTRPGAPIVSLDGGVERTTGEKIHELRRRRCGRRSSPDRAATDPAAPGQSASEIEIVYPNN